MATRWRVAKALSFFSDLSFFISLQKLFKIPDRFFDPFAVVRIRHGPAFDPLLHVDGDGVDVAFVADGFLGGFEGLMGNQGDAVGVVYQGIACGSGFFLISFREAAVDDQQLAVALDRGFAPAAFHRHMAVDDMAGIGVQAELR